MALTWNWKEQTSSVEVKCTNGDWMKCKIYQGNALAIIIAEYEDNTYNIVSFMCDRDHAIRCFDDNCFEDFRNWELNGNCKNTKSLSSILSRYKIDHKIFFTPF